MLKRGVDIKKLRYYLLGFLAGVLNGFFGSGGGLMVVPMLEATKLEPKKSHATSIAIIFPLSIISAVMYLINRVPVNLSTLGILLPLGAIGAVLGSFLLMKLNNKLLKRIFGIIMIISAVRILLK